MERKQVTIYTDGACKGNPGPGGYGVVLLYKGHRKELSGGYRLTTNNRMEMMALIVGLEALKTSCELTVITDSKYLMNAFTKGWIQRWKQNGWRTQAKQPVQNQDLWLRLDALLAGHQVTFQWTKGHANDASNNRCDELAVSAATSKRLAIDEGYQPATG